MLSDKVKIITLGADGCDSDGRRLFSAKGEMAQIFNRSDEYFRHLVYWDLDSPESRQERGHHYHKTKSECYYIISGELELYCIELETGEKDTFKLNAGDQLYIQPMVAHAFKSLSYAQVLEVNTSPYEPGDTFPYQVSV